MYLLNFSRVITPIDSHNYSITGAQDICKIFEKSWSFGATEVSFSESALVKVCTWHEITNTGSKCENAFWPRGSFISLEPC